MPILQSCADPTGVGSIESQFCFSQSNFVRQDALHGVTKNPLAPAIVKFQAWRTTHGKFHQSVIQKWVSRFDRMSHGISIFMTEESRNTAVHQIAFLPVRDADRNSMAHSIETR